MMTITTIAELEQYIESGKERAYALRGATPRDLTASEGDYLSLSLDTVYDDNGNVNRDCDYSATAATLDGTSGIAVTSLMCQPELRKMYDAARGYADLHHETGVVYLIAGNNYEYGDDPNEVVISNKDWCDLHGAKLVAKVIIQ